MSHLFRSMLRDAMLNQYANPSSRALRRLEDELLGGEWPVAVRQARYPPEQYYAEHPAFNRQLTDAVSSLRDFAEEIDSLADRYVGLDGKRRPDSLSMQRSSDGSMQLALDVSNFKPQDIKINLVDNHLVIEAKNENSGENSYHKSEFKRWFKLPENCKLEEIKSNLTKDNQLLISLPSSKPAVEPKVRSIPITVDQHEAVENKPQDQSKSGGDKKSTEPKSK